MYTNILVIRITKGLYRSLLSKYSIPGKVTRGSIQMQQWIANLELRNKERHEVMVISEPFTFKNSDVCYILVKFQKGIQKGKVTEVPANALEFVDWVLQ